MHFIYLTIKIMNILKHFLSAVLLLLSCHAVAQLRIVGNGTSTLFVPGGTAGIGGTVSNANGLPNANVGIGTDNPLQKLHIDGAIRGNGTGGALRVQTAYGYLDLGAQDANYAHINTDRRGICMDKGLYLKSGLIVSLNTNELKFINRMDNRK